jgi:hypothetical protein
MHTLTRLPIFGAPILILTLTASPTVALLPRTVDGARLTSDDTAGAQGTSESRAPASPKGQPKHSHAYDFLIRGTVFSENALAFPGVQLRVRRAGEKKFHWETYSNSRGEFAIRVPQGTEYELVVHSKGFRDQTRAIDARAGDLQDDVVFRMEPAGGEK